MRCFPLQDDYLTVRGASSITKVIQADSEWLTLDAFQDIIVWLDVKEVTAGAGNVAVTYETSPTCDDFLFQQVGSVAVTSTGLSVTKLLASGGATNPLARYLRWKLAPSSAVAWDITFRIWLAANAPGPWRGAATALNAPAAGSRPDATGGTPSVPLHLQEVGIGNPFGRLPGITAVGPSVRQLPGGVGLSGGSSFAGGWDPSRPR